MMRQVAKLHIQALPYTWSSKRGEKFVDSLYQIVKVMGYVKTVKRGGEIVGVMSGIGPLILTLVVAKDWQRKGVGKELIDQLKGVQLVYTNKESVGFYEKIDFVRIGQIEKTIFLWRKK
ncbi:MAG: GNAT family N-acetyltransferase [bacterium]